MASYRFVKRILISCALSLVPFSLFSQVDSSTVAKYEWISDLFQDLQRSIDSIELPIPRKAERAFKDGDYDTAYAYCDLHFQQTGEKISYMMWKCLKCQEIKEQLEASIAADDEDAILARAIELMDLNNSDPDATEVFKKYAFDIPQVIASCLSKGKYELSELLLYTYTDETGFKNEKLGELLSSCDSLQYEMYGELGLGNMHNVKEKAKEIVTLNPKDVYAGLLVKDKKLSYYESHVDEIPADANAYYDIGCYEKVILLCDQYRSITGSRSLDGLKVNARKCIDIRDELNEMEESLNESDSWDLWSPALVANKLLEVNPNDFYAIWTYRTGWK